MNDLASVLRGEYERILKIKEKVENRLRQSTDVTGKLRIATRKNEVLYYHRTKNGKSNGKYLQKKEEELARKLAQKTYDEKVLRLVSRREKQFQRILNDYCKDEIEKIYLKEKPQRQQLITPVEPTWQQKVDAWLSIPYQAKSFSENDPLILTDRGMRVRSKSEREIANYLDQNHIPYKYECPLYLKPYGIVYPDFTILSQKTGQEIYWEHEGRMDDAGYARNAIKKIELYQANGILLGNGLILTFETTNSVLNIGTIRTLTTHYLSGTRI